MNDDFALGRNRPEDIIYRPDYKPAEELKLDTKVQGLKGVTDFESFNQNIKRKKKDRLEQT